LLKNASCQTHFFSSLDYFFHNILFQNDVDAITVFGTSGDARAKKTGVFWHDNKNDFSVYN
jgi:hypothetical protein